MNQKFNPNLVFKVTSNICVSLFGSSTDSYYEDFQAISNKQKFYKNQITNKFSQIYNFLTTIEKETPLETVVMRACYVIDDKAWLKLNKFDKIILLRYLEGTINLNNPLVTIELVLLYVVRNLPFGKHSYETTILILNHLFLTNQSTPVLFPPLFYTLKLSIDCKDYHRFKQNINQIKRVNKAHITEHDEYSSGEIISMINKHREVLTNKFGVTSIYLYGSYALQKQSIFSDIDLLIMDDIPNRDSLKKYISDITNHAIDLSTASTIEDTCFYERIKKYMIKIF